MDKESPCSEMQALSVMGIVVCGWVNLSAGAIDICIKYIVSIRQQGGCENKNVLTVSQSIGHKTIEFMFVGINMFFRPDSDSF